MVIIVRVDAANDLQVFIPVLNIEFIAAKSWDIANIFIDAVVSANPYNTLKMQTVIICRMYSASQEMWMVSYGPEMTTGFKKFQKHRMATQLPTQTIIPNLMCSMENR